VAIKEPKSIHLTDYETGTLQRNFLDWAAQVTRVPFLSGNLLTGVSLSTTPSEVAHGLGRPVVGYWIIRSDAHTTVFDTLSITPNSTIKLTGSATSTVSIWIY